METDQLLDLSYIPIINVLDFLMTLVRKDIHSSLSRFMVFMMNVKESMEMLMLGGIVRMFLTILHFLR